MRIHYKIRTYATFTKWKVLLLNNGTTHSLLSMSAAKLVSKLGQIVCEGERKQQKAPINYSRQWKKLKVHGELKDSATYLRPTSMTDHQFNA